MEAPDLQLTLIPAPGDELTGEDVECLRREFEASLTSFVRNTSGRPRLPEQDFTTMLQGPSFGGALALQVVLAALGTIGAPLGTMLGAWLHARYGRKVRLKVGDIEAEAQTREEVEKLIARAQEIQQRNQPPKVIP